MRLNVLQPKAYEQSEGEKNKESHVDRYLGQSPGQNCCDQESKRVQGQTGDLIGPSRSPICGQEVDSTRAISNQAGKTTPELICMDNLEGTPPCRVSVGFCDCAC